MIFWRNKHTLAIALIIILITAGFVYYWQKSFQPSRKPDISQTPLNNSKQSQDYKWYIEFSVEQQKSTAYTEASSAPVAANGHSYYYGGVAVHPRYALQYGGKATEPIIPFGTEIFLKKPITVQGEEKKSLIVTDTGDVNYGLWPEHPYWFDIYWGNTNYYNDKDARQYGSHLTDYYWYEPWE